MEHQGAGTVQADVTVAPRVSPSRLDVFVHLLAIEQSLGRSQVDIDLGDSETDAMQQNSQVRRSASADALFDAVPSSDWIALSQELSSEDGDGSVFERLDAAATETLVAKYAPGGQLVGGSVDLAVALHLQAPIRRVGSSVRTVDRSVSGLRRAGFSNEDLRCVLRRWAVVEKDTAVVLLDAHSPYFDVAESELCKRYDVVHSEPDFISELDRKSLNLVGHGSVQTLLLSAGEKSISTVLRRHSDLLVGSFLGNHSAIALSSLWSPLRPAATNQFHERRIRKIRRATRTAELRGFVRSR